MWFCEVRKSYSVTLTHAGQSRTLEMDIPPPHGRHASSGARTGGRRRVPGRQGYIVQHGNLTRFDRPHSFAAEVGR